ncbi:helix-turn-helix domain-containing protein [Micromonospora echinofusca]|uniref:Helix-turn-helix domain-containing protein n=1 Tax=Micromonospora echinofusca TaxID=47858 RepID=A0ABS3VJ94_MICEH|nr:helix-turn-helix domain-containing protein [Micromonospora echinofusca]
MTPDHDRGQGRSGLPELLLGHRLAAGFTQAELASRAGVGVRTVRDLERGRSVRPQRTTVELLAAALQLAPADRAVLLAAARGHRSPAPADGSASRMPPPAGPVDRASSATGPVGQLPPATELIGRDDEVAGVVDLLAPAPDRQPPTVVSLVGLAGVGKTALALAVARAVPVPHRAGVLVGEGSDVGDVLTAVAGVFGAARPAELVDRLGEAPALLVIDAVERAPGPVAEALTRLTGHLPGLRVLATGRHPVGLPGERVWPVTPLDVPPPDGVTGAPGAGTPVDLDQLAGYPAVRLFLARLGQVRREPPRTDELAALGLLVRRLGGLPLAIELVAARGRILDLNDMLDRYGDRVLDLATATAPRPATAVTMRDEVAASYHLLAPDEQRALRELSAFRNRWSLTLAEELLATGTDLVALLDRLLELGLLSVRGSGEFRFRLLDVVRDFAAEQATIGGEATVVRRRHAVVLTRWATRTAPELAGADPASAVCRFDEVSPDLSTALSHAANDDPHTALALAAALSRWWGFRGRDVFGRRWLRRLLDDPRTADADPRVRADARLGVARLAAEHGAGTDEVPAVREALAGYQRLGDLPGEVAARTVLCALLTAAGGYDEARAHGEAALALAAGAGRNRDVAMVQLELGRRDVRVGDLRAARRRLAVVGRLAARCGDARLRSLARMELAEVERLARRYDETAPDARLAEAVALLTESLSGAPSGLTADAASVPAADAPPAAEAGALPVAAVDAAVEGCLALRRGELARAAEWFAVAAAASR